MTRVAVVYHSQDGHTKILADAIAEGAASVEGAKAALHASEGSDSVEGRWSNEDLLAALDAADAIAFGSPTHMGSVSGPFKAFLDGTLHRWYARAWLDKVGAAIARPESISGFGLRRLRSSVPGYGDRQETA